MTHLTPLPERPTADDLARARAELWAAHAAPALHRLLDLIERHRPILDRFAAEVARLGRRAQVRHVHAAYDRRRRARGRR